MPNQWDDARIGREAKEIAAYAFPFAGLQENLRGTVAERIVALVHRVRDEQREADAVKCDEIADYHRAQAEDWWENHVVCAESCAAAIRGEKG